MAAWLRQMFEDQQTDQVDDCVEAPRRQRRGRHDGYWFVVVDGRQRQAHVVVCEWRHGPRPSTAHEVAHSCGRRSCVNPWHLRWATSTENAADRARHGRDPAGERNPAAILTWADVDEIRRRRATGERVALLASEFGVAPSTIYDACSRKWQHR